MTLKKTPGNLTEGKAQLYCTKDLNSIRSYESHYIPNICEDETDLQNLHWRKREICFQTFAAKVKAFIPTASNKNWIKKMSEKHLAFMAKSSI